MFIKFETLFYCFYMQTIRPVQVVIMKQIYEVHGEGWIISRRWVYCVLLQERTSGENATVYRLEKSRSVKQLDIRS